MTTQTNRQSNDFDFTKYTNTAQLLGAKPLQAIDFSQACFELAHCISAPLKSKARKTILSTNIYDKTFEQWLEKEWHKQQLTSQACEDEYGTRNNLMSWEETKEQFHFALVKVILDELFTKWYHETQIN